MQRDSALPRERFEGCGIPQVAAGTSQTERVADTLVERIRSGQYPIRDRLPSERQLAAEFGVSRPVVREALRMLTMLRIVDIQVGRGAFVIGIPDPIAVGELTGPRDLLDALDASEVIESGALSLAHSRATPAERRMVADAQSAFMASLTLGRPTDLIDPLRRAIIDASGSEILKTVWAQLEGEIRLAIEEDDDDEYTPSAEDLADLCVMAAGVVDGTLESALAACKRLHVSRRARLTQLRRNRRDDIILSAASNSCPVATDARRAS